MNINYSKSFFYYHQLVLRAAASDYGTEFLSFVLVVVEKHEHPNHILTPTTPLPRIPRAASTHNSPSTLLQKFTQRLRSASSSRYVCTVWRRYTKISRLSILCRIRFFRIWVTGELLLIPAKQILIILYTLKWSVSWHSLEEINSPPVHPQTIQKQNFGSWNVERWGKWEGGGAWSVLSSSYRHCRPIYLAIPKVWK